MAPSALRPGALAGRAIHLAGPDLPARELLWRGATLRAEPGPEPLDLLVVDLRERAESLADPPTRAFACARAWHDALARRPGGMVLLLPCGGDPDARAVTAAGASLARTVAREWAPEGIRANGIGTSARPDPGHLADLLGLLASPAAAMLTGQLMELCEDMEV